MVYKVVYYEKHQSRMQQTITFGDIQNFWGKQVWILHVNHVLVDSHSISSCFGLPNKITPVFIPKYTGES